MIDRFTGEHKPPCFGSIEFIKDWKVFVIIGDIAILPDDFHHIEMRELHCLHQDATTMTVL